MCFIKANLAFIHLKILMLFHRQRQWAEKLPNTAVNTAATTPSPSTLYSQKNTLIKTSTGDVPWFVCTWSTVCLNTGRMKKTRKHSPCSQISFLSPPLPLGCFAQACCQRVSFRLFLGLFLGPLHCFSLSHPYHPKSVTRFWERAGWWMQVQLNFEEFLENP